MDRKDIKYAARAKLHGARHVVKTIEEARAAGVPLSWAFALVEQESGFRNVFGHDRGSILQGQRVTAKRVRRLLHHVDRGGISNGVGLTQLTWPPLLREADRNGGAHKPRVQLRYGLRHLAEVARGDLDRSAWRYNGAPEYQARIKSKQSRWHVRLTK